MAPIPASLLGAFLAAGAQSPSQPPVTPPSADRPTLAEIVEAKTFDGLAIAPDGASIAYRLMSRSVANDSTTVQWFVQPTGGGSPRPLGHSGVPMWVPMFSLLKEGAAVWSPDSSAIYTLLIDRDQAQVHRLSIDGADQAITADAADVESFSLSPSGDRLIYQTRASRAAIDAAVTAERRVGLHFDRTVATEGFPLYGNHRVGDRTTTVRRVADDDATGEVAAGGLVTHSLALPPLPDVVTAPAKTYATVAELARPSSGLPLGRSGIRVHARIVGIWPSDGNAPSYQLIATMPDGRTIPCKASFCTGPATYLREIVSVSETSEVVVLHEQNASARSSLQAWNPATGRSRTIRPESGSLDSGPIYGGAPCPADGRYLYCIESGPTRPQRLVKINLVSGRSTPMFDPNASLAAKAYPTTRFLTWVDSSGQEANGVLVMPYDPGSRIPPLVITTYRCRGYLSGGVAAVTPEFILAERGMAALCVNFNSSLAAAPADGSPMPPLGPHKAALDAYAAIIAKLGEEHLIDPERVGVSGHSFSANVVTYAISHTKLFRAAVIGSGPTIDPATYPLLAPAGDSWRKQVYDFLGLPRPQADPHHLWDAASPALNASASQAPLLMQPPENEYAFCLQQYAYDQDAGAPVDMYVYPGEGHLASMMPSHQYWRGRRSVDWFDFWLQNHKEGGAETEAQYSHWEALRAAASARAIGPAVSTSAQGG